MNTGLLRPAVATVPTIYGIETIAKESNIIVAFLITVATVPTIYGIETFYHTAQRMLYVYTSCNSTYHLRY